MAETQTPEWQDSTLNTDSAKEQDSGKEETVLAEEQGSGKEETVRAEEQGSGKEEMIREEGEMTERETVSDAEADVAAVQEEETGKQEPEADDSADDIETAKPGQGNEGTILKTLSELTEKMDQMNLLFTKKIQHTTHEEKILDQMHAELQKYKEDMYAQLVRPILMDIIEIRESIRRVSESFALKPEEERANLLKTFSDYTYDLQDVLEKNNIAIYDSKEGDDFNALKHRVIKKDITPVEELHGKIAKSLSSGYEYIGKTISPEKVVVYVYQKPENTEGEN